MILYTPEAFDRSSPHPISAGQKRARSRAAKRLLDIVVASLGLALFSPVLLVSAALIKLTSRGPVLFVQSRRGQHGRIFRIYKLRTLDHAQCDLPDQREVRGVVDHDRRVIRVGWFLRARGIDEIPQLWNVLRGEMSIVGPRPYALPHDDLYLAQLAEYSSRFSVKPGITGWAQVNGYRGTVRTLCEAEHRLILDRGYIARSSLLFDLAIMLRTLAVMFGTDRDRLRDFASSPASARQAGGNAAHQSARPQRS